MGRSITMMISPVRGGKKTGEAQDEEEKEA
jgi:hypothetical protein